MSTDDDTTDTIPQTVLTRRQWAELNGVEMGCMMPDRMPLAEENADEPIAFEP